MASLSEDEKRELLVDARSVERRQEFAALRERARSSRLTPDEFLEFLNWSQHFIREEPKERSPIKGDVFIL